MQVVHLSEQLSLPSETPRSSVIRWLVNISWGTEIAQDSLSRFPIDATGTCQALLAMSVKGFMPDSQCTDFLQLLLQFE